MGLVVRALYDRLHGNDGPGTNIEGRFRKRRVQRELFFRGKLRAGPEVIPIAGGQVHVLGIYFFRDHRSDEKIAAEEEGVIIVVVLLRLREFEKNGLHQG